MTDFPRYDPAGTPDLTNACNWGEDPADTNIDLVNSVRVAFTGLSGSGKLIGALLAVGRADIAAGLSSREIPVSVHSFALSGATLASAVLTFRYDDGALLAQGLPQGSLKVWRYNGASWDDVTGSVDAANKHVTTTAVTGLGQFALTAKRSGPAINVY